MEDYRKSLFIGGGISQYTSHGHKTTCGHQFKLWRKAQNRITLNELEDYNYSCNIIDNLEDEGKMQMKKQQYTSYGYCKAATRHVSRRDEEWEKAEGNDLRNSGLCPDSVDIHKSLKNTKQRKGSVFRQYQWISCPEKYLDGQEQDRASAAWTTPTDEWANQGIPDQQYLGMKVRSNQGKHDDSLDKEGDARGERV